MQFKTLSELRCELVGITQRQDGLPLDLMPVSAARASTGTADKTGKDIGRDLKLMGFLAEHQHMTPFEHVTATFLVEAPLFVARQWMRHRTQSFNEVSMRYTDEVAEVMWVPTGLRKQAEKNLQCSDGLLEWELRAPALAVYKASLEASYTNYRALIRAGVSREQARAVLPTATVTRFYVTANIRNWTHWYALRIDAHAQPEIQHYAQVIGEVLSSHIPETWKALTK